MTVLYDVFNNIKGETEPKLIMRAPLSTIRVMFRLHDGACRRILSECSTTGDICTLHLSGAILWPSVIVQRAVRTLDNHLTYDV